MDDPYVEHIDLWDFFVDPDAKDIDSAKYCIHWSYPTIEELEQKAEDGLYKNIDEVKKAIATSEEQRGRDERLSSIGMQSNPLRREDEIVLIEYWEDDRNGGSKRLYTGKKRRKPLLPSEKAFPEAGRYFCTT